MVTKVSTDLVLIDVLGSARLSDSDAPLVAALSALRELPAKEALAAGEQLAALLSERYAGTLPPPDSGTPSADPPEPVASCSAWPWRVRRRAYLLVATGATATAAAGSAAAGKFPGA